MTASTQASVPASIICSVLLRPGLTKASWRHQMDCTASEYMRISLLNIPLHNTFPANRKMILALLNAVLVFYSLSFAHRWAAKNAINHPQTEVAQSNLPIQNSTTLFCPCQDLVVTVAFHWKEFKSDHAPSQPGRWHFGGPLHFFAELLSPFGAGEAKVLFEC